MPKNTVDDWDVSPDGNTDVGGISVAEGCPPGNINNAIRMVMAQIKSYAITITASLASKANTADLTTLTTNAAPPGTLQFFMRKTAPTGWVRAIAGTIGNASSGATIRSNADCLALFTVLWTDFSNTELVIQTSAGAATTRGVTALDDFNAGKRMPLFDVRDKFVRASDEGAGYDASLTVGTIQADAIKSHSHTITDPGHSHVLGVNIPLPGADTDRGGGSSLFSLDLFQANAPVASATTGITINNFGASETRPMAFVALACVKL